MKSLENKEIVVTGAAGFMGSSLCRTLLELGAKVTAYDNLYSGKMEFIEDLLDKGLNFLKADIRDPTTLEKATKNMANCLLLIIIQALMGVIFV